jgi:hypothetical protein
LEELAQRLVRGDSPLETVEAPADEPPPLKGKKQKRPAGEPPPFPKFPAFPEHGHRGRFIYDLVVWFGHLLLAFWGHLPKFVRIVAATIVVFNLISLVFKFAKPDPAPSTRRARPAEVSDEVKQMLDAAGIKASPRDRQQKAGDKMESLIGAAADALQARQPVTLITFTGEGPHSDYASDVFGRVCSELMDGGRPSWGLSPIPLATDAADAQIVARGVRMRSRFVLTAHAGVAAPGLPAAFTVRLFSTLTGEMVWKETYELEKHEAAEVADLIAAEVRHRLKLPAAPMPPAPPAG